MIPAAAQVRVGARLAKNGSRLIIGAQRAYLGFTRLASHFAGLAGMHPRYTRL